jgi:hypothetical protein
MCETFAKMMMVIENSRDRAVDPLIFKPIQQGVFLEIAELADALAPVLDRLDIDEASRIRQQLLAVVCLCIRRVGARNYQLAADVLPA